MTTKSKIVFVGNFWEYFFTSIALLVLTMITFGLLFPYWLYWSMKYFFSRMVIEPLPEDEREANQVIGKMRWGLNTIGNVLIALGALLIALTGIVLLGGIVGPSLGWPLP